MLSSFIGTTSFPLPRMTQSTTICQWLFLVLVVVMVMTQSGDDDAQCGIAVQAFSVVNEQPMRRVYGSPSPRHLHPPPIASNAITISAMRSSFPQQRPNNGIFKKYKPFCYSTIPLSSSSPLLRGVKDENSSSSNDDDDDGDGSNNNTPQTKPKLSKEELEMQIQDKLQVLNRAAETKQEDSDAVYDALVALETFMRQATKLDPTIIPRIQQQLTGSWRLVFTTGTAQTQKRAGGNRINYFPLKAIQSFDTTMNTIENGIYIGDFIALQFKGTMDFDESKCRLNFDFTELLIFNGFIKIPLQAGQAASLGAKSGLGSESNVVNAARQKKPFFNWISADATIATARGGGGGLALWKRV